LHRIALCYQIKCVIKCDSISEESDEDENDNNDDEFENEFVDVQPEPDSDLAEQSLFISNNKTIAYHQLTLNLDIILLKIILAFVILYRHLDKIHME